MTNPDAEISDSTASARGRTIPKGILALTFAHLLLGIVLGYFSSNAPAPSSALFFSLIMAQTCLLGMWGGLGGNHWIPRVLGVVVGALYLWIVCGLGIDELEADVLFVIALATGLVMGVCWIVRRLVAPIARYHPQDGPLQRSREGLQFGIRHLMALTLVVACLVTAIKTLSPHFDRLHEPSMLTAIAVCFVSIALTAIWAMLGLGPPLLRGSVFLVMSGLMGWVLTIVIDERRLEFFWFFVAVRQAVYMVATLAVVRLFGYRLLRPASAAKSP